MFRNHLKIAFRNLFNNKIYSFINIFGLAVGLATCLLIMLYIYDESRYDQQYKDGSRIYRVVSRIDGESNGWAALAAPVAAGLKAELPEVEQCTRVLKFPDLEQIQLSSEYGGEKKAFSESNGYYVDSTFFQIFSHESIYGDLLTALYQPNSVVISGQIAEKFFGNQNPVGQVLKIGLQFGEFDYTISGVFKNESVKSHIPANFFLSMRNADIGDWERQQTSWATNNIFYTYIKLKPGTDPATIEQQLQPFFDRRAGADMKAAGFYKRLFMQPLQDIYLHSHLDYELASNGNITFLYILGSIAAFILLIACINFMNLATARSEKRAKEVGVRKVVGAQKRSLAGQFLSESFLMSSIALLVGLMLAQLLLPFFNSLIQKKLQLFGNIDFVLWIAGLALLTGLLSGLYPAFYLSGFKPIATLKGKIMHSFSAALVRKGLVVFQFTISICLILGAIVIWQQLGFLQNQDLGFRKDQQIVIPLRSETAAKNFQVLKNELLKNQEVLAVTNGSTYPGIENINDMLFYAEGKTINDVVDIVLATIGDDYFETLGFELLYGRGFSEKFTADSASIILNEAALKALGYEANQAVGRQLNYDWRGNHYTLQIVGVVKDFNFQSLHNEIKPFGFATTFFSNPYSYAIANIKSADYFKLLNEIESAWSKVNSDSPFDYSFIDLDFQKNYEKDLQTSLIVGYFTVIAIFIACLGLFGLAAFSAEQRAKEIGIRKVLGASVWSVTTLLSKDLIRLVAIAILLSSPLAWYLMQQWLQGFAYRIDVQWWVPCVAGLLAVTVAFLTVSFQSIKAALADPVQSLRNE